MQHELFRFTLWSAGACVSAYGIGAGLAILFSGGYGGRYGSNYHRFMHYMEQCSGGRIAHVQCVDMTNKTHVKVFGIVCAKCGYVSVGRILSDDDLVQDEVFDRHPGEYCWTELPMRAEGAQLRD